MWHMKFFWNSLISKKWSKSRCESSRNCGKKKISKIVKISNFHGVCNKIRLSTQCKHNSKHFSEYHIVFNTPGTLQILTSKFGFTVALKPQRNWKNSKIVHFSHMDPHKFRRVDSHTNIVGYISDPRLHPESNLRVFVARNKIFCSIFKNISFWGKSSNSLKWSENVPCGCKSKKNVGRPEYKYICLYHSILTRRKLLPAEIIQKQVPIGSQNWPQKKISYV